MRIILFILLSAFVSNSAKKANVLKIHNEIKSKHTFVESRWTGTITLEETSSGITGTSERHVTVRFNNALPTLNRDDGTSDLNFTDDKGTGSQTFHSEAIIEGKKLGVDDCQGSGPSELHEVIVDEHENYYKFSAIGPAVCSGTSVNLINGITTPLEQTNGTDIIIENEPLGAGRDVLSGTQTRVRGIPDETASLGTVTTTITWHLTRSTANDVELVVKPDDYDRWLPEPGKDELHVGSILNISLKLQKRGGGTTTKKAKAFELHLSNTSSEPGITINFPTVLLEPPMPDLRFEKQVNGAVAPDFQRLHISCPGGCQTANAKIGSYDGGGWTVLTVEAILTDNTRIQGRLLESNGELDIRIPKRDPNSKIGERWSKENGNPNETDDDEVSRGNSNDGDGLTAYEEYRGVISEGKFKRLEPDKKELGIKIKRAELSLFTEAFQWFENASKAEVIRFYENEIARNRRLNKNALSAHDYDQYVIRVEKRNLPAGVIGTAYNGPALPAVVDPVVFDLDQIRRTYQIYANNASPDRLKFTVREYVAQTVAHEIGHAVNIWHHGEARAYKMAIEPADRIFDRHNNLLTHPDTLKNIGYSYSTPESGNMSCMLNYYPFFSWGRTIGADGASIYNQEPLLPLGTIFCESSNGTDINATDLFFGKAHVSKGNCLGQIKLR